MTSYNFGTTAPNWQAGTTPGTQWQTPAAQTGLMTVFVNSEAEVANYPVAAGLTVMLVAFGAKRFWLKGTGANGIPEPIRTFEFAEVTPKSNTDTGAVTREEFDSLSERLEKLIDSLGGNK